ncbi:unnamed protein product [Prorocentrum cordatum]|uniref:Uncharacterized protein n=1 Tax=Prorocentrum cordatum TaxID=2364126 RepID=A0ABN9WLE0_9DINO|nr:unnamed protein product [Polarella glacialis]
MAMPGSLRRPAQLAASAIELRSLGIREANSARHPPFSGGGRRGGEEERTSGARNWTSDAGGCCPRAGRVDSAGGRLLTQLTGQRAGLHAPGLAPSGSRRARRHEPRSGGGQRRVLRETAWKGHRGTQVNARPT